MCCTSLWFQDHMSTLYPYPQWSSCHLPILGAHCAGTESSLMECLHLPHRQSSLNGTPIHDFRLGSSRKENMMRSSAYSKFCTGTVQIRTQKNPSTSCHSLLVTCSSYPSSHHHRQCHQRQKLCCFDSTLSTTSSLISVRRGGTCQSERQVIQNFKHCSDTNPFYEV